VADAEQESCDACEQPWAIKFEWTYTDPERYCLAHILEPIDNQPGKTLLDFMPDCQNISHRITTNRFGDARTPGRQVKYRSLAAVYPILTGRMAGYA
jgi:hypothetical protein